MYKNMSTDELAEIFVDNLVATNRGFNFYVNGEMLLTTEILK